MIHPKFNEKFVKWFLIYCLSLTLFGIVAICGNAKTTNCPAREALSTGVCEEETSGSFLCIDACYGHEITSEKECKRKPECCYIEGKCVSKKRTDRFNVGLAEKREKKINEDLMKKFKLPQSASDSSETTSDARNLQIPIGLPGGLPFPLPHSGGSTTLGGIPSISPTCIKFPYNCPPVTLEQIITPPVDIPYCQREYCSVENLALEDDIEKCLSKPGCYFDRELHALRRSFGHQVMPRVPVCHLAIRNHNFLKISQRVITELGDWNPALTECLTVKYYSEIFDPPRGCDMNDLLEHFGFLPKMAGWIGITKKDCFLINGCWKNGRGCFYPMQISKLFVKSGQSSDSRTTASPPLNQNFGLPKCQDFDSSTPTKFLKSYHNCLASGCTLDQSITNHIYYYNLWNVTNSLPTQLQYLTWRDIASNNMRADNFEQVMNGYRRMSVPDQSMSIVHSFSPGSTTQVANLLSSISSTYLSDSLSARPNSAGSFLLRNMNFPLGTNIVLPKPSLKSIGLNPCPYKQVNMYNFPNLKGRFTGCCDRNLCYLPRDLQSMQKSGMSSYFSAWGLWSSCSKSCGGGRMTRHRECVSVKEQACEGRWEESVQCSSHSCPEWGQWESYRPCSVSCGGGKTHRSRKCRGKGCIGKDLQYVKCNTGGCPKYSDWSEWTPCSTSCGKGVRLRTRKCADTAGSYKCPTAMPMDEMSCWSYCGNIEWSAWSECDVNTCKMTRTSRCVSHDGGAGFCQNIPKPESRRCNQLSCYFHMNSNKAFLP